MTTREADKLIKSGSQVTLHNAFYHETFTVTLVRRDRWNVYTDNGQTFDRGELQVVEPASIPA